MGAEADASPITGTTQEIAEQIAAFSTKVDHVQVVIDPITLESIETMGTILSLVRAG